MTTYTQTGREALIQELAHGQKYNTSNGELLDMSYVMSDAANVITSLSDELEKLRAAPSTSPDMSDDLHIAYMVGYSAGKLAESNQWQPIETAPKDGASVLTWCDPCVEICFMHGSVWITGRFDDFGEAETPTHWMPLPPPAK